MSDLKVNMINHPIATILIILAGIVLVPSIIGWLFITFGLLIKIGFVLLAGFGLYSLFSNRRNPKNNQ